MSPKHKNRFVCRSFIPDLQRSRTMSRPSYFSPLTAALLSSSPLPPPPPATSSTTISALYYLFAKSLSGPASNCGAIVKCLLIYGTTSGAMRVLS